MRHAGGRGCAGVVVTFVLGVASVSLAAERGATTAPAVEGALVVHEAWSGSRSVPRLFVLLPPSYATEGARHYPVLYALDGQDLFDSARAAGGEEWTLDEILARRPAGVSEMLVVGVESGADALRAQAPPGAMAGARGDSTLGFLADVVRPFVAAHYRILPGRERSAVLGVGNGALFAAFATWRRGDVFASALALGCPDVDAKAMAWIATPPAGGRPWIWLEQLGAEAPRPSSTDLLAALERHADVQMVVTGLGSSRTQRLLAALVAWSRR